MSDIFRFPNGGYDVEVCRKQDIISCVDADSDYKEVMLALVTQCEVDAANFLKEGRWTGIPYLGNMRVPQHKQKFAEIGGNELLETAKESLDKQRYSIFRKDLNATIAIDIKAERLYRYMTSCYVTKHRRIYNHLVKSSTSKNIKDGDAYARFMCYSFIELNNYISFE